MGLDSYLYLEKYENKSKYDNETREGFYPSDLKEVEDNLWEHNFLSKTTRYQVAYWRKANQIHSYFVNMVGNGEDRCQDIYVDCGQLEELVERCKKVLENHDLAEELLPTQSGFFFGSTEYDEWYIKNLELTIKQLEPIIKVLKENNDYECYYQASW